MDMMKHALEQARIAFDRQEVPVGAVIALEGKIISVGYNQTESLNDPTAHAEIIAIRKACEKLGNWRLTDCILYTTLEPCAMCAGAILQSRLKKVVWGAPDIRCGGGGSFIDVLGAGFEIHQVEVETGVLAEESAELMRTFFRQRRQLC